MDGLRLDGDERVLWHGAPPSGLLLRREDVFLIPFSMLWFGFALFWQASVMGLIGGGTRYAEPPTFVLIVGFFFVCIGLYFAFGRFAWDAYVRGGTRYALTNRRALIQTVGVFGQVESFALTPSSEITSSEDSGGYGTITFGQTPRLARGHNLPGVISGAFMFERITNVREAMRVIREIQNRK
jgi:hypothetical protein